MKSVAVFLIAIGCLLSSLGFVSAQERSSVRIDAKLVRGEREPRAKQEEWIYLIRVHNISGRDLEGMELRYRVYQRRNFDSRGRPTDTVDFDEGSHQIATLPRGQHRDYESDAMYFPQGEVKVKARDVVQGVWVKVIDRDGKEQGVHIAPTSLTRQHEWAD